MQCQTVQPGTECTFWTKNGCTYEGNSCQAIVEDCKGCDRVKESSIGEICGSFPSPEQKWAKGLCNFATHRKVEIVVNEQKVNPLKASKKAAGK